MRSALLTTLAFLVLGCGTSAPPPAPPVDMTVNPDLICAPDPSLMSSCGQPCDKGNALGVGMFCKALSDCMNNSMATLCARLGDPNEFFCTFMCVMNGPQNQCGADATCQCQGGQCGCFPNACNSPSDGGT